MFVFLKPNVADFSLKSVVLVSFFFSCDLHMDCEADI